MRNFQLPIKRDNDNTRSIPIGFPRHDDLTFIQSLSIMEKTQIIIQLALRIVICREDNSIFHCHEHSSLQTFNYIVVVTRYVIA